MNPRVEVEGRKKKSARQPRPSRVIQDIRARALSKIEGRLIALVENNRDLDTGELLALALRVCVANMADTKAAGSNAAVTTMLKLIGEGHRIMQVTKELQDMISAQVKEAEVAALSDQERVRELEIGLGKAAAPLYDGEDAVGNEHAHLDIDF